MTRNIPKRAVALAALSLVLAYSLTNPIPAIAATDAEGDPIEEALAIQNAFVEVAETTAQAVVTIGAEGKIPVGDTYSQFFFGGPSWAEVRDSVPASSLTNEGTSSPTTMSSKSSRRKCPSVSVTSEPPSPSGKSRPIFR
jgi:hypothetical protein